MDNAQAIMVPVKDIIPNRYNARKNDAIEIDRMVNIIKKHGFEEPLVAYQQGKYYVLYAGHRRLSAAKKAGFKKIPLFIREQPKDKQEEMEKIASLQSGRVDWTQFEWAKFTYERWVAWDKPSISKFAEQINMKRNSVNNYITVMDYYPEDEIATDLENKNLTISTLFALVKWVQDLRRYKPDLVEAMTEDMIRQIMLEKIKNKTVTRDDLRNREYPKIASEEKISDFLTNKNLKLESEIGFLGAKKQYEDFNGHLISLGHVKKRIPNIKAETDLQKEKALESLNELQKMIQEQIDTLKK